MKILDMGCGMKKLAPPNSGDVVIGLDSYKLPGVDVVHDVAKPLPFKENEFDMANASHIVEHLDDVGKFMKDVWRILKPHGILKIACPHFSSFLAYGDLTHKKFVSAFSFDPWIEKKELNLESIHHVVGSTDTHAKFILKKRYFDCSKFWFWAAPIASRFPKFYEGSFMKSLFPMACVYFEFEAIK